MYQTVQFLFYVELAFKHSGGQHAEKEFRIHIVFLVYMLQLVNPILHLVHLLYLMNVEVQRVNLIPYVLRLLHMCMLDFKNAFGMVDFVYQLLTVLCRYVEYIPAKYDINCGY